MNEETKELDLSQWLSTYGILTAERILERFQIHLQQEELITTIKNPRSIYYQLLRVPLKNVFNGIILQQGHDYQVYAQKLFIDYLLSGQNDKAPEAPGATIREDIENERTTLAKLNDEFNEQELAQQKLIAESQAKLIHLSRQLKKSLQTVTAKINEVLKKHDIIKAEQTVQRAIRLGIIHGDETDLFSEKSFFWTKMEEVLQVSLHKELRHESGELLKEFAAHRLEIDNILATYLEQTQEMTLSLRNYRKQFYELILRATELIKLLPDYYQDTAKQAENLAALDFDGSIGEQNNSF
ncbi:MULTISPECIES: hypothetical protein [Legionella]|uniref:Uncharacterized protein n=1 Tax=Legionella septentrionalis TaxID=2498109 RepID=A0A3S0VAS0_9GAMM|nr:MULTISPECIES: hypothetical protein [Legionella]MCP0912870.1 hypothetical protein [Legionella sp. 27cVA30]RUQ88360.1 hypothetical protein EKM59_05685 [Legionella septentrionalis]RUQ95070.1 hypothetical protein ELY11_10060 [Legionella septentrionalis]RUR09466.1 hypothetical protein ELY14_08435 [Legionella septentrionalis]RUR13702.1 hypothetical protein ELY10_10060 [Legionella septentrionalis]